MGSNSITQVDIVKLWNALSYHMFVTDKQAKEVSAKLGFHPNVITKIKQAARLPDPNTFYQPSAGVLLALSWWIGADPRDFQTPERPTVVNDPVVRGVAGTR